MDEVYGEDYYERGLAIGISGYSNYRWMPELTIPLAMTMIDHLGIERGQSVLDFGCAKGYLVRALRLLYRDAWGVDISTYAIANVDLDTKEFCFINNSQNPLMSMNVFDFCIAKDVFEHINEDYIGSTLKSIPANKMLVIIPLGENGKFKVPVNNLDVTHVICKDELWWIHKFSENGFTVTDFTHHIRGIKDAYVKKYPKGHGVFTLCKD